MIKSLVVAALVVQNIAQKSELGVVLVSADSALAVGHMASLSFEQWKELMTVL